MDLSATRITPGVWLARNCRFTVITAAHIPFPSMWVDCAVPAVTESQCIVAAKVDRPTSAAHVSAEIRSE